MSLAGKLEDVALADVMQFIHLGRRTGTLTLQRGDERAEVNFHRGAIVGAHAPTSLRLGELLVDEKILTPEQLEAALAAQRESQPRRSLGQVLFTRGVVSVDEVRDAIRCQIEKTIYELVTWTHGSFVFELDTLKPVDDIAIFPGDLIPDIDLNTQMVLLEAARIFDERNREPFAQETEPPPQPSGPARSARAPESVLTPFADEGTAVEGPTATREDAAAIPRERAPARSSKRPVVHLLLGDDADLAEQLEARLGADGVLAGRVEPADAGEATDRGESVILICQPGSRGTSLADLAGITTAHPGLPVICVLDAIAAAGLAYEAGAAAVVPRDVEAIVGCFQTMARFRGLLAALAPGETASRSA